MNDLEQQLSDHLRADGGHAEPEFRLDGVMSGAPTLRPMPSTGGRSWLRPVAAAAAVAAVTIGGLTIATRGPQERPPAASAQFAPINWSTEHVTFAASSFAIDVNGQTFAPNTTIDFDGDPGDDRFQTLEVTWMDNVVEMRWYVTFASDGIDWWVKDFQTYNGDAEGDWVTFNGEFFRTPIGTPFSGDVDLDANEDGVTSRVRIDNMILQPFTTNDILPAPPLADGSPPPLPPGLPRTGVEWTSEGNLALTIAEQTLMQECMSEAGWDYDIADPSVYVAESGMWFPHPVLGIGTVEAAEADGYHRDDPSIVGAEAFAQTLPADEQQDFYDTLTGSDDSGFVPITAPDGTSSGEMNLGGCFGASRAAFDNLTVDQEGYRQVVNETGIDQEQVATDTERDPRIQAALSTWRSCVEDATGETAETPNELARRFAFEPGTSSDEIAIATADARCQDDVGLRDLWSEVYAEYQRFALGDDADLFDTLALMRVEIVDRANQILDDRGIELPET